MSAPRRDRLPVRLVQPEPAVLHPELPQNIEAEKATLGSILLNREAIVAVAPWLKAEYFYYERHSQIYQAMLTCFEARIPPDSRTVSEELRQLGRLEDVGGLPYLNELVDAVPTSYHIEYYARIVERTAELRLLIAAGGQIARLGYEEERPIEEVRAEAQTALTQAIIGRRGSDGLSGSEATARSWEHLNAEGLAGGILTGWRDFDEMIGGLWPGTVTIVAARTSVGKTSFALSMIRQICRSGIPAAPLIFSLEMGWEEITHRFVSMESGVSTHVLRTREIAGEAMLRCLSEAYSRVGSWSWQIYDIAGLTPSGIRTRAMQHLVEHPGSPIFIDYLGLIQPDERRENRVQDVAEISRALKALARDANVPLIVLCQLSRAVDSRQSHVPLLSDLRDSGAQEEDADIVAFIYREELYDKESDKKGIAEIHIAKHRNGPLGIIPMRFSASVTRFDPLVYRDVEGY